MALGGCGGPTKATIYPVKGKLTKGGQPLVGNVRITFLPADPKLPGSLADVGPDGTFTAKCVDGRDGAVAGQHKIILEVLMRPEDYSRGNAGPPPAAPFPDAYKTAATTPKQVEVKASTDNDITIDIP